MDPTCLLKHKLTQKGTLKMELYFKPMEMKRKTCIKNQKKNLFEQFRQNCKINGFICIHFKYVRKIKQRIGLMMDLQQNSNRANEREFGKMRMKMACTEVNKTIISKWEKFTFWIDITHVVGLFIAFVGLK